MAADGAEPKLIGYAALKTISRTAGLLRRHQDRQEPSRKPAKSGGTTVSVDLVNGKLLQTIHGISLIQVRLHTRVPMRTSF